MISNLLLFFSLSCSVLEVFCILKSLTLTWIVYSCIRVFSFSFLSPCDYVFPTCCVTVISGLRSGYDGSLYCVIYATQHVPVPNLVPRSLVDEAEDDCRRRDLAKSDLHYVITCQECDRGGKCTCPT